MLNYGDSIIQVICSFDSMPLVANFVKDVCDVIELSHTRSVTLSYMLDRPF